ncbi:MAG: AbgT family transporter [Gammaproteobacteria bacterium]|nr:AbgT family transporter [Gammaproteobacteria bacterium]
MSIQANPLNRFLSRLEHIGNRLPHPAMLFVYLCGLVLLLSLLCALAGVSAVHPVSGDTVQAINLLNSVGLHKILTQTVTNFTQFAPVGTVLVAIMGIGIAEHSGLIGAVLRAGVTRAPAGLLTFIVVFAGVMSSLAADTGYVVLVPLAAMMFVAVGRHPLAGIAAAFAGVSGGYSANLLIGPLDVILAGLSSEAAHLVDAEYEVSAAGNYYFIVVSTLLVSVVGTWVTERLVEPRLAEHKLTAHNEAPAQGLTPEEKRGLIVVALFSLGFAVLLLWGLVPADGLLRDPETGSVLKSPFIRGIVVIIAVYAGLAGILFGRSSGKWKSSSEFVLAMERSMVTMAGYLVLMFFAAQFVSYFSWSQLGVIAAINGAQLLQVLQLPPTLLLLVFVFMAAAINLLVGSASAKWALIAPIFVPMLMLLGIAPEATQMAFRIGDSATNIITPLMPYFGVVVAYAQAYDKSVGIGTIMVTMLPYSVMFLLSWSLLLLLWLWFGWPLGPGVETLLGQ